ncbi:chorismate--pyruvate lyase family protein [Azoarcus taiwanensis]|uniref:Probable chorismate pyruvate-lyase n=1 Tax=Azoarcus taiwanensis TaxID=666964 RepID=A0A972FCY4_9RHOO|nr:chorismate lyase [Azoarcus taiwanensis]NMG03108.1 chorismate lyase [Azoarcus taiwanensis]
MPLHWRPRPLTPTLPPGLRPWLTDTRSLTARIVARSGRFHVAVLEQRRARPMSDERALFSLRTGEYLRVREVILYADDQPVVYARSVVSERDLRLVWRVFRGIGSRPLGAALFADPRIRRQPLFSAALKRGDARYHRALIHAKTLARPARLWARRSLFRLRGRDLLVTEVFLPAVLALSEPVKRNTRS